MQSLETVWEIFIRFLWPLALAYAGYLHWELRQIMSELRTLQKEHFEFKSQANERFATQKSIELIEARLTSTLNRIDDKVTRILEREAK